MKVPYAVPQSTISRNIRHASAPYAPEQPDLVALKESLCRHIRRHKEHLDHFRAVSNVFRLMPPSKEKNAAWQRHLHYTSYGGLVPPFFLSSCSSLH